MLQHRPTAILFFVGLLALAVTAWQAWQTATFSRHAVYTTGVIADPAPHPTIRASTPDGNPFTFVQNGFISRPAGAEVPIAYDAADPAGTAQAWTFWTSWGTALWLLPMGLGFTILPLLGMRAQRRGHR